MRDRRVLHLALQLGLGQLRHANGVLQGARRRTVASHVAHEAFDLVALKNGWLPAFEGGAGRYGGQSTAPRKCWRKSAATISITTSSAMATGGCETRGNCLSRSTSLPARSSASGAPSKLRYVSVGDAEARAVYNGMTRCPSFTHEGGVEAPPALPEPDEFIADVEALWTALQMIEKNTKATEKRRLEAGQATPA